MTAEENLYEFSVERAVTKVIGLQADIAGDAAGSVAEIIVDRRMYLRTEETVDENSVRLLLARILPVTPTDPVRVDSGETSRLQVVNFRWNINWAAFDDYVLGRKPDWIEAHPVGEGNRAIYLRNGTGPQIQNNWQPAGVALQFQSRHIGMGASGAAYVFGFYNALQFPITIRIREFTGLTAGQVAPDPYPNYEGVLVRIGWVVPGSAGGLEVQWSHEPQSATESLDDQRFHSGDPEIGPPNVRQQLRTQQVLTIQRPTLANLPANRHVHFVALHNLHVGTGTGLWLGADVFFSVQAEEGPPFSMQHIRVNVLLIVDASGSTLTTRDAAGNLVRLQRILNGLAQLSNSQVGALRNEFRYAVRVLGVTDEGADGEYGDPKYKAFKYKDSTGEVHEDEPYQTNTRRLIGFGDALNQPGNEANRVNTVINAIRGHLLKEREEKKKLAYSPIWRALAEACDDFQQAAGLDGATPHDLNILYIFSDGDDTVGGKLTTDPRCELTTKDGTLLGRRKAAELAGLITGGTLPLATTREQIAEYNRKITEQINARVAQIAQVIPEAEPGPNTLLHKFWQLKHKWKVFGDHGQAIITQPGVPPTHPLIRLLGVVNIDVASSVEKAKAAAKKTLINSRWCHAACRANRDATIGGAPIRP